MLGVFRTICRATVTLFTSPPSATLFDIPFIVLETKAQQKLGLDSFPSTPTFTIFHTQAGGSPPYFFFSFTLALNPGSTRHKPSIESYVYYPCHLIAIVMPPP